MGIAIPTMIVETKVSIKVVPTNFVGRVVLIRRAGTRPENDSKPTGHLICLTKTY